MCVLFFTMYTYISNNLCTSSDVLFVIAINAQFFFFYLYFYLNVITEVHCMLLNLSLLLLL